MKKALVTGGCGFIGSNLTKELVKQGWQVTLIEREKKCAQKASGNPSGIISPKMTAEKSSS